MKIEIILPQSRIEAARAGGYWPEATVLDYFDRDLERHPERIAVVDHNSMTGAETRLTYAELEHRVRRIAAGLARHGIERGDVVSCQLPNWWQAMALHLATLRIGAVPNPLITIFRERELGFMLDLAETRAIVVPEVFRDCRHGDMLESLRSRLPRLQQVLVVGADGRGSFDALLDEDPGDTEALFRERRPAPDDLVQILYTSGTTGEPKGVMHTSNTLLTDVVQHCRQEGFDENTVTLMASPVGHQSGFVYGIVVPIMIGAKVVLQDIWRPAEAIDLIAREGVTYSVGSTPFLADLLDAAEQRPEKARSLRIFLTAGAPIPPNLVSRAMDGLGVTIRSMWGMSEAVAVSITKPEDPPQRALESDGCAVPGMELRIVDAAGAPVAPGVEGRLMVRGAGMFVGYLKRPQLYVTDAEGWFDTGDLGRMDAAGYLRITGRSKDIIIRGGENIPVVEIENLMYQHPALAEVAIVGMPDARLGERGCAFVVLRPGAALTLAELSSYLLSRQCAKSYLPERLEIVEAMPRTASGKIQKFKLREAAQRFGAPA